MEGKDKGRKGKNWGTMKNSNIKIESNRMDTEERIKKRRDEKR